MAFFDDVGRKLSQATQATAQKAKDIADVSRLNGAISEEERKVNNSYYQIGKLYVTLHPTDHEPQLAGLIASIKESERKIIEYRAQIQEIKGVTRCEKCGAEVSMNMAFCSSCGSPMPQNTSNQSSNMIKCIGCGQMVSKDMRFCTSCGKPMADILQYYAPQPTQPAMPSPEPPAMPSSVPPAMPSPVPPVMPSPEPPVMPSPEPPAFSAPDLQPVYQPESVMAENVCPGCGSAITSDMVFCTGCGIKLK